VEENQQQTVQRQKYLQDSLKQVVQGENAKFQQRSPPRL
jgi:hypothetical protein